MNDDRLTALRPIVAARVRELAALAGQGAFEEFFDSTMRAVLNEGLRHARAHEGTVWLLDESRTFLIPRFNNGPNAEQFVGRFRQSLRSGMISMVVSTEQPICENEVHKNQRQDKALDHELGVSTCAMLATPLYFAGELRGVLSAVQLKVAGCSDPEPPGFGARDLNVLELVATVLARLVEQQFLSLALGLEDFG